MVSLSLILATSLLALAEEQVVDVSLDSTFSKFDRLVGSIGGGTELFFKGTWGFVYSYDMEIKIGKDKCKIEESYDKLSVVSCLTPSQPEKSVDSYDITVYHKLRQIKFAANVPSIFYYDKLETSILYYTSPPEFMPGERIDLSGDWVSQNPIDIIEVRIAEKLTMVNEDTEPVGDISVTIGDNMHWDGDLKIRFSEGETRQHWVGLQTNKNGELYNFRTLSKINYISRKGGSEAGGMEMTIQGEGFPTHSYMVEVEISGILCKVVSVASDRIEVITGAEIPKLKGPYYEGGAGLYQESWFNQPKDTAMYDLEGKVDPDFQYVISTTTTYETLQADSISKFYGLFLAPYDGEYTFYAAASYKVDVLLGKDMSPKDPERIIANAGGVGPRQYFVEPENQSKKITLEGGKSYYFQMNVYSEMDNSYVSVGVETPIGKHEGGNEMPLVQRLKKVYDESYTPPSEYYNMFLVEIYGTYEAPYGGYIRFRVDQSSYHTTEYIVWDNYEESWACKDIEDAFEGVKIYLKCKMWKEKTSIFYEFTPADKTQDINVIEVDTYYAWGKWKVYGRSKSKEVETKHDPVKMSYSIVFKNEKSSEFDMSISPEDLQKMLNKEIKGFWDNLLVWSYEGKDGESYFYFLLPGYMFKDDLQFIEIEKVAKNYMKDPEKLDVVQRPGFSKFWWVIPSDFLRTLEEKPQVRVSASGSYAMCPRSCSFIYTPALYVDSFEVDEKNELLILESKEGFPLDVSLKITVGEGDCSITWVSGDQIKCTLKKGEAGKHVPVVTDSVHGLLPIAKDFKGEIKIDLVIDNVNPTEGGDKGGTYLTLMGSGFPANLERALEIATVMIGDSPCEIRDSTFYKLVCVTSMQTTDSIIKVEVNKFTAETDKFNYNSKRNLDIDSVSPKYASGSFVTEITITGKNFGSNMKDIYVSVGYNECYLVMMNDEEILCKYLGGPHGYQDLVVYRAGIGEAWKSQYPVIFKVSSVEPTVGSIYGGTEITIKGEGFSPNGFDVHRVLLNSDFECEITAIPDQGTIICITPSLPEGLAIDTPYELLVIGRLQDIAECYGDCSFTWSTYRSPRVDSIDPSEGVAGTMITLTGQYFGDYDGHVTLTIGDQEADILSVDDSTIEAIVPSASLPYPKIVLNIEDRGNAYVKVAFINLLAVLNVEPKAISQAGATVTVFGSGFFPQMNVAFGNIECEVGTIQSTFFQCDLPASTESGQLSLSISGGGQNFVCADVTKCAIEYLESATPEITGVTGSETLRIEGDFLADISEVGGAVTLDDLPCTVTSSSTTLIECTPVAPSGTYEISVYIEGFGFAVGDFSFTVALSADPVGQYESSFAGGRIVILTGSGLTEDNSYTVCGVEAEVISAVGDSAEIKTPVMATAFSQLEYEVIFDEVLVEQFQIISNNPATERLAFDKNTTTFYTDPSVDKFIGVDVGEGMLVQLDRVNIVPGGVEKRNYRDLSGSELQGSTDGVTWETIFVFSHVDDRKNEFIAQYRFEGKIIYRFFRVFKKEAEDTWAINEFELYGALMFEDDSSSFVCPLMIVAPDETSIVSPDTIIYSTDETPQVTEITPERGSALGGDTVVFYGSGFGNDQEDVSISIDGVPCKITRIMDSKVECTTGPKTVYVDSTLDIWVRGKGYAATRGLTYLYSELWSDPRTWGNIAPPKKGDSVYIAPGQVVVLDVPTPALQVIAIEGTLIVDDVPGIKIEAEVILVHDGKFEAGTQDKPFVNELEIKLNGGVDTTVATVFGNKMILVISGNIDIYGQPRKPTWSFLGKSAMKNQSYIELDEDVDWKKDEEIVIAPSGYHYYEAEKRTITKVQGRTVYLDKPLEYNHYSAIETYGKEKIDMRTEVGLLTRNIKVVPGKLDLEERLYGTHILMSVGNFPVNGRIAYVEFPRAGQAYRRLKYPVHYHISGLLSDSYLRGNAFHGCHNRAITVHGATYAVVEDNVAYDIMGHTYFIEDGNEFKNVFKHNLGIYTKQSFSLLNTDRTPATFWIANPDNFYYDNHAAGSKYYGIWYDPPINPPVFGFGDAPDIICTQYSEIGGFSGNTAHSNGVDGLKIEPRQIPVANPCEPAVDRSVEEWWSVNPAITAYFTDFTAYKNKGSGIEAHEIGDIRFVNTKVADNLESGIQIGWTEFSEPYNSVRISNALIIGSTYYNDADMKGFVGIKTPQTDGLLIENVKFHNIGDEMYPLGDSLFSDIPRVADYGARVHKLSGLEFNSSRREIKWNIPFRGIYEMLDDSLTGTAGDFIVASWSHLYVPECAYEERLDSIICRGASVRRVHFYNLSPLTSFLHQPIKIQAFSENSNEKTKYSELPMITTDQKKDIPYSWAVPVVTGHPYNVHWGSHPIDWETLNIEIDTFKGDEWVRVVLNVTDTRGSYSARRGPEPPVDVSPDPTILEGVDRKLTSSDPAGTYTWEPGTFEMILSGTAANEYQFNDIEITASRCPEDGCHNLSVLPDATETVFRYWSDKTQWPGGNKPQEMDSVVIAPGETVVLDESTPVLKYLEVNGELVFDDKRSVTLNSNIIFIRAGAIRSGTKEEPISGYLLHAIKLHGGPESEDFVLNDDIDVGNQVLINTGVLEMHGHARDSWTVLEQNAKPGDDFIFVKSVDWQRDQYIVLAPTGFENSESEIVQIVKVSTDVFSDPDWTAKQAERSIGKGDELDESIVTDTSQVKSSEVVKLHLNTKLKYYHAGTDLLFDKKSIDMRGEVGLLQRNIAIWGAQKDWNCSILTTSFADSKVTGSPVNRAGKTVLDNVDIAFCGQIDSEKAALRFEANPMGESAVTNSVITRSAGVGLFIDGANNIKFTNNVLFHMKWRSVVILSTRSSVISDNLAIDTLDREKTRNSNDKNAAFYVCVAPGSCSDTVISKNHAAGYSFAGFILSENFCGQSRLSNGNVAHSGYVGLIISNMAGFCIDVIDFSALFNELGITTITPVRQLLFTAVDLIENKLGLSLRTGVVPDLMIPYFFTQNVTDSRFVGKTHHSFCNSKKCQSDDCKECEENDCEERIGFYTGFADYEELTVDYEDGLDIPLTKQRDMAYATGTAHYRGILVANYRHNIECKTVQHVLQTNPLVPDFTLPHFLSDFYKEKIGEHSLVYMNEPDPDWASPRRCGNWVCTGLWNVLIEDRDGSFIGEKYPDEYKKIGGVVLPNNPGIASRDLCKFYEKNNAYICHYEPKQKDFYEIYVYEETFGVGITTSPVNITSIGPGFKTFASDTYVNELNSFSDHKFEGEALLQGNLRRFPAVVYTGLYYNLSFFGTQSIFGRCYVHATLGRNISIGITHNLQDTRVYGAVINNTFIPDVSLRWGADRHPDLNDNHATNRYYYDDYKIAIILREEILINIRVQGDIRSDLNLDYFVSDLSQNNLNYPYGDMVGVLMNIETYQMRSPVADVYVPPPAPPTEIVDETTALPNIDLPGTEEATDEADTDTGETGTGTGTGAGTGAGTGTGTGTGAGTGTGTGAGTGTGTGTGTETPTGPTGGAPPADATGERPEGVGGGPPA